MVRGPQTSKVSPSETPLGGRARYPELSSEKPYLHAPVFHTESHTPRGVEKPGGVRENSEGW